MTLAPQPCSPRSAELRDAEAAAEASSVAAGSGSEDICRFCLEGAALGELIAPCRCRGSSLYVHESCLSRWRAMKERAFSSCLECGASYKLRLRRPAAGCQALGLWRTRALDVLLRDFIPVFLLLQLVLVGLAYGLAAADPRRRAFRALGGYTCRVTALMPPPRGFGIGDDDDDASYDEKARALAMAAAVTALRKACTREFYYIAAFFVAMASAAAVAVAAAVGQWLSTLLCSDDNHDSIAAEKQQAEPPAPGISPLAPRDMCVIFTLVLSAWLVGGVAGGVLAFIAAALRSAQLRALQRQRWRLVRCYAVVDGAYAAAGQGCERAHALPDAHRDYLRTLGFLPPHEP